MSCRCSEISRLKRDISNLKKALSYAGKANTSKSDTLRALNEAAEAYEDGVVFAGSESNTALQLRSCYNKASGAIAAANSAISRAISNAESRLSSLRSEDERYHSDDDD